MKPNSYGSIVLSTALLCIGARCPAQLPDNAALARTLIADVAVLSHDSMQGRRIGTPGGARARTWLVSALAASGVARRGDAWEHPFVVRRDTVTLSGVNLIGMVRGTRLPERYIVVTAHYDHLGVRTGQIYNGADDNASGTAALLALARATARAPLAHSVLFVLLDGEESGLQGARALLREPPVPPASMVLNINMDMVGRNAAGEIFAAGTHHYPFLRPALDSVATRSPVRLRFGHDLPGTGSEDWTSQSDHGAFHAQRIPFVYFGEEDHPDYHRPTDDVERLMPEYFAGVVRTIHDALLSLDRVLAAR